MAIIPGIRDLIPTILSIYLIRVGVQLTSSTIKLLQMIWNVLFNFHICLLPVIGDYIDFFNHANLKNLAILKEFSRNPIIEGEILEEKKDKPGIKLLS